MTAKNNGSGPRSALQVAANRIFEGVFIFFYGLLRIVPIQLFEYVAKPLLRVFIYAAIPQRRVVRNISAAFGQSYSSASKNGLAKGVREHFVQNLLACFLQIADDQHVKKTVHVEGIQHLETALGKGRGVLALGAHIGNFVLLPARFGIDGYRFNSLFRIPPDARIKNLISRFLPRYHHFIIPSLPKQLAVRKILEALKRNEIVYILGDNLKKGRIDALLFGQKVPSPRGPISLALRSGAPVIPMYLIRNYQGRMQLIVEPELELIHTGNMARDITTNTRRVITHLEALIRRYPDQWNWLTVSMKNYRAEPENRLAPGADAERTLVADETRDRIHAKESDSDATRATDTSRSTELVPHR